MQAVLRLGLVLFLATGATAQTTSHLGLQSGQAIAGLHASTAELKNEVLDSLWQADRSGLTLLHVRDQINGNLIPIAHDVFILELQDGSSIASTSMHVLDAPKITELSANPSASRLAEHFAGKQISVELEFPKNHLRVSWRAFLRDGSNYIRQEIELHATRESVPITGVQMLALSAAQGKVIGSVRGSPVVAGDDFAGFEHPLSQCEARGNQIGCALKRVLPLRVGESVTYSSVVGVTRPGQLRRDFLAYVERERAHPYRTFLHYNTWYDLGYFGRYDQAGVLDRIRAFGEELTRKRGVKLDSFLLDDGWDDPTHLWHFNTGFPDGLTQVRAAGEQIGAAPGIWMSPWGGYSKPKQERLQSAKESGYEIVQGGLALSGPRYFEYFRKVCLEMIERYGVNQFKFDGTGNADRVVPGSHFDSDFDAAITLISELRARKPDLYVNLTTGTFPSPFWLRYADSIWRGGDDHDFAGVGSFRQRWITYRDADTYQHVVQLGPLFPLNSLMLHGVIYAQYAKNLNTDPHHDFADEVHSYFGTGTQLQEMYITPSLLSAADWDTLAQAAKWSRNNADILRDTHWIGGDPAKLEVYGWAAWSTDSGKGIVTLRNPSDRAQSFSIDVAKLFELPKAAPQRYHTRTVWNTQAASAQWKAAQSNSVSLQPFEVITFEADPVR
ncbi:MAG TPA: enterotoxin [Terriglobales bacterium]|nr:enterotoxin [Terriglobales bacterium]